MNWIRNPDTEQMVTVFWYWGRKKKVREEDVDTGAAPAQGTEHSVNRIRTALSRKDLVGERLETGKEIMEGRRKVL